MDPLDTALPVPPAPVKAAGGGDAAPAEAEETRGAVELTDAADSREADGVPPPAPPVEVKENRWKLAFRQLMFMKRMNMQVNDRDKNEIELRQHNITPLSLMCSVPFFNAFSSAQIQSLVDASQRMQLRPGDSLTLQPMRQRCEQKFFIVASGNLACASTNMDKASAIRQANLSPQFKLGIGDHFAAHQKSDFKVIAMEPVEYLVIPMEVIAGISDAAVHEIEADNCDISSEMAETASFKHWALQYTLATQRSTSASESVLSPLSKGIAKCSLKQFSKDFLVHFSPENELDHTLEYMKLTLMGVFKARRVRMFIIDHETKKLVVKFSDDQLSQGSFDLGSSLTEQVLQTREAVYAPNMTRYIDGSADKTIIKQLYKPTDRVIATPMFEFDQTDASRGTATAPIVAVLEVVMEMPQDHEGSPLVTTEASENDMQIVEVAAQELSRYLFFHYQDFFTIALMNGGETDQTSVTEVFPARATAVSDEKISLTLNQLSLNPGEASITHAVVSIRHGKMQLASTKIRVRLGSPTKEKSTPRSYLFDASVDLDISLGNIPHGSHLLIQFHNKKGLTGWSGVHLFDFGHGLRTGTMDLDVSNCLIPCLTALDIENCTKSERTTKKNAVGSLRLTLDCTGTAQGFSFSSLSNKPKRSITFRASIFGEKRGSKISQIDIIGTDGFQPQQQQLLIRLRRDPLAQLTAEDQKFVWDSRHILAEDSALLPAFLLCVDWSKCVQVMEAYRMLILWRQPTYLQALQLLSPMYPDPKIRAYAVRCMHSLPDHRLRLYLLQLVQALKNERYHDSALARFLLMRALQNPAEIGYSLYWFLKAEVHVDQTAERFSLIMGEYMQLCGSYKLEIRQSVFVMRKLEEIAAVVKHEPTPIARRAKLHEALRATVLPETFQLPLHPRAYCNGIIIEPCRVMESKKRPLFLQLESAKAQHGNPFVIFKSGDDLRQDQLVLQILRVMDDLWRVADLDLCLSPYACISTGDELGLIEVVGDSSTLATIIYDRHEGSFTKLGRKFKAAKDALVGHHVISEWLFAEEDQSIARKNSAGDTESTPSENAVEPSSPSAMSGSFSPMGSPTRRTASASSAECSPSAAESKATPKGCFMPRSPSKMLRSPKKSFSRDEDATQNFLRSCAGYCVATYVLGIGDRHNDNIMLQRSGKFFHIDFGHFLGNFKSKFGIKREKAPFVFTPAMLHVIDADGTGNFEKFKDIACQAFRVLRAHSNLLITLLVLALTCGTPELTCEDDIKWVHRSLMLELTDDEACEKFRKLIHVALHTKTTRVNDAVHLMAH